MASLDNFILFDVANAIITDKQSAEKFLNKFLTTSNITQSTNETEIRGGQGAGLVGLIESEKSIEITIANAVISKKWLEMQQGAEFKSDALIMTKTEKVKLKAGASNADPVNGELTSTPTESELTIINCDGDTETGTILSGNKFEVGSNSVFEADEEVTVMYKTSVANAEVLEIDSAVFPKGWELQLEVPAKDRCTGVVTHKVVFIFDNVTPSSSFDMAFAMGEAIAPEMTLKVMKSCCSTGLGRMAIVPINA